MQILQSHIISKYAISKQGFYDNIRNIKQASYE